MRLEINGSAHHEDYAKLKKDSSNLLDLKTLRQTGASTIDHHQNIMHINAGEASAWRNPTM